MSRPDRGRGPGLVGLAELDRLLSARDWQVLDLLAEHRFLTTRHLEQFVFTTHHTQLSAARTCRRVLARLGRWHLVERPMRRVDGLQAGSASSIWMITSSGQRLRHVRAGDGAIGRVREPGERFIAHYLAIADTHLALVTAHRDQRIDLLKIQIEPHSWRPYTGLGGSREVLKPDLFAITGNAEYEDHWFLEVDRATESLPTLVKQCQHYETYRRHGVEQSDHGVFPRVLWIVPDGVRVDKLRTAIAAATGLDAELFRVSTPTGFLDVVSGGAQ